MDAPPKSGTTSYTTHFVFVPKSTVDIPGVGKAVALEATGPTENTAGEKFLDKMKAKCAAVSIDSGGKKWIDGACALTDADGDVVFSTFDTRDLDKSQPKMDCGTHIVTGTGKYKGITGKEPFACINKDAPAGSPEGAFATTFHTIRRGKSSRKVLAMVGTIAVFSDRAERAWLPRRPRRASTARHRCGRAFS